MSWRRWYLVLMAGVAVTALSFAPVSANARSQASGPQVAAGRIIVKLEEEAPARALANLNRSNGAEVEERLPLGRTSVVDLPDGTAVKEAVAEYEDSPAVEYAEPDYLIQPEDLIPDDPDFDDLYGLRNTGQGGGVAGADIGAPRAWDEETGSQDTVVAVIDTGVQIGHPDLKNNIWTNADEIPNNGEDDDGNGYVDDVHGWDFYHDDRSVYDRNDGEAHGTHVAGTIAAEGNNSTGITGVSWRASVMPLKFLGPNGGYTSDAAAALDYAVANGAVISNNSWGGGGYSQTLQAALDRAQSAGHLFVAAAGNDGADTDASPHYPSGYANGNIISVAATDNADRLASFSNYGARSVDLAAPGVSIESTLPGGEYGFMSGTSMASPHVAGAAALLKSRHPSLTAAQIRERLLSSAAPVDSLAGETATGGRLEAAGALGLPPVIQPALGASAGRSVLTYGQRTAIKGALRADGEGMGGRRVVLKRRAAGQTGYVRAGEVYTDSAGRYSFTGVSPARNTYYRAYSPGVSSEGLMPAASPPELVKVRPKVSLMVGRKDLQLGRSRAVVGRVSPRHGGYVKVQIRRNGALLNTREVRLSGSEYRLTYRPPRPGRYTFRAIKPLHGDHLMGSSSAKGYGVFRP